MILGVISGRNVVNTTPNKPVSLYNVEYDWKLHCWSRAWRTFVNGGAENIEPPSPGAKIPLKIFEFLFLYQFQRTNYL